MERGRRPGTPTKITGLNTRANAEDSDTDSTSNPDQIPAAGTTNYSYWVATRLQCTTLASAANGIANLRSGTPPMPTTSTPVSAASATKPRLTFTATGVAGTGNLLNIANYGNTLPATAGRLCQLQAGDSQGPCKVGTWGSTGDYRELVRVSDHGGRQRDAPRFQRTDNLYLDVR